VPIELGNARDSYFKDSNWPSRKSRGR
jgi:hypothetical protein